MYPLSLFPLLLLLLLLSTSKDINSQRKDWPKGTTLRSMTRYYSIVAFIASGLAILFILMSPVAALGYAFDTESCSPEAIEFLDHELKRAITIARNSARVLGQRTIPIPSRLYEPITYLFGDVNNWTTIRKSVRAVFEGGTVQNARGSQIISGITSYGLLTLPNFNSTMNARPLEDREGNLVLVHVTQSIQNLPFDTLIHLIAHIL